MKALCTLVSVALSVTMLTSCENAQDPESSQCVSPLKLDGRTYLWVPAGDEYVVPGDEVGTATIEPCTDSDSTEPGESSRTVYAFPDVSPDEAIVATDGQGQHGLVYRSATKPAGGWDVDLESWLDDVGAVQQRGG
jgi:hypothetical protein